MSDDTTVRIEMLRPCYDKALALIGDNIDASFSEIGLEFVELEYHDLRYGVLEYENILRDNLIPYSKEWDAGGDFTAGAEHFRVLVDGTTEFKAFEDSNEVTTLSMAKLIQARLEGPEALNQLIIDHENSTKIMSWKEQSKIIYPEATFALKC
ncbi:MAG: hypothetical protein JKX76_15535 [Colwellia sp.]|nr:hypothetical protein [Colwellia sp.]